MLGQVRFYTLLRVGPLCLIFKISSTLFWDFLVHCAKSRVVNRYVNIFNVVLFKLSNRQQGTLLTIVFLHHVKNISFPFFLNSNFLPKRDFQMHSIELINILTFFKGSMVKLNPSRSLKYLAIKYISCTNPTKLQLEYIEFSIKTLKNFSVISTEN